MSENNQICIIFTSMTKVQEYINQAQKMHEVLESKDLYGLIAISHEYNYLQRETLCKAYYGVFGKDIQAVFKTLLSPDACQFISAMYRNRAGYWAEQLMQALKYKEFLNPLVLLMGESDIPVISKQVQELYGKDLQQELKVHPLLHTWFMGNRQNIPDPEKAADELGDAIKVGNAARIMSVLANCQHEVFVDIVAVFEVKFKEKLVSQIFKLKADGETLTTTYYYLLNPIEAVAFLLRKLLKTSGDVRPLCILTTLFVDYFKVGIKPAYQQFGDILRDVKRAAMKHEIEDIIIGVWGLKM